MFVSLTIMGQADALFKVFGGFSVLGRHFLEWKRPLPPEWILVANGEKFYSRLGCVLKEPYKRLYEARP